MLYKVCYLAVLFFIYSFIGYIVEVIYVSITEKRFAINRGFLIGPYLPIYAVGILSMILLLQKYKDDLFVLFAMSVVICSIIEYVTSYILEKLFNLRWWDYSELKFNINGRICLLNSTFFGFAGVLGVRYINPYMCNMVSKLPSTLVILLGIIFIFILFTDLVISNCVICKLKIDTSLFINKDATTKIREEVMKSLDKYSFLHRRLFKAFPNILEYEPFKIIAISFNKYKYKILKKDLKTTIKELKRRK